MTQYIKINEHKPSLSPKKIILARKGNETQNGSNEQCLFIKHNAEIEPSNGKTVNQTGMMWNAHTSQRRTYIYEE